ncbi:MAG: 2,3-bisphosphoglycerate-independent phosphoglycerate mutase [Bacteroidetes bacterium]|nr:2,3-bisphosphoglycerate-independent phosphoglycerate mutase [Bacteroidota bacterium]
MAESKKVVLVIMDGWGIGDGSKSDVIANSNTPFVDSLYKNYPHSWLLTSGEHVGLPDGQMGNSEVGHLNIGAGRIVYQDLVMINKAIKEKTIDTNPILMEAFEYAKKNKVKIHLMGLVSNGGVHSSQEHLHKLCSMAQEHQLQNVFVHCFTDGRDTDPKSGLGFISKLQQHLSTTTVKIASICGRYYAMDRDKRWERVKLAYNLLVKGEGDKAQDPLKAIQEAYANNITDEFIKPIVITNSNNEPLATIADKDVVICFNFRTDRCREITEVLSQKDFPEFDMKRKELFYVTMTNYDDTFLNVKPVFDKDNLNMTLGEVMSKAGKKQIRIAETEKYPHVTFFFSGGREAVFEGETRLLIQSPKVATYDLQPEMSAHGIADAICTELKNKAVDFVCLNFANADMVGHTGVYAAVQKAVETVDSCVKQVVQTGVANGYSFIIIADHGNADFEINADGSPNTAHTTNPVPCILIDAQFKLINKGKLADVAPTILKLMQIPQPSEMTGISLV